jgi:hypothetical protein
LLLSPCLAGGAFVRGAYEPGFPRLGTIRPRSASEIGSSGWSIGGETLDRDFAIYDHYKAYLGPLGARAIRLQAGWAKCEKRRGEYEWAWLDEVVDDALAQGVRPWLETSYGNPIYPGGGGTGLGGGLPSSPEALEAWNHWVGALVRRYKDRVHEWEIWNEPDINRANDPSAYLALFVRTATVIRAAQPAARIYGLALAGNLAFAETFLKGLNESGKTSLLDAVTFHGYPKNPDDTSTLTRLRALLTRYAPASGLRQGETGAPSTAGSFGALADHPWSELTQAKWDLRRMLTHLGHDVPFNLFTLMDLHYPDRVNTKGLLRSRPDKTVDAPKPAYRAAQHVFAVFDDSLARITDYPFTATVEAPLALYAYGHKATGQQVVAIWFRGAVPEDSNATAPVDFTLSRGRFRAPVYVDLREGHVLTIPADRWAQRPDGCVFRGIPVYDSPVLIAERERIPLRP